MIFRLLTLAFAFVSFSYNALAHTNRDPLEAGFAPLQGSAWAQQNKGKLPYKGCVIESIESQALLPTQDILSSDWSFLFLSSGPKVEQDKTNRRRFYITCTADSQGLAYRIPIYFTNYAHTKGFLLNAFKSAPLTSQTKIMNLKEKFLQQAFGVYEGVYEGGGIILIGGSGSQTKNEHQVKIRTRSVSIGKLLEAGKSSFLLSPRVKLEMWECQNPFVLLNTDIGSERVVTRDCKPNQPFATETATTDADIGQMSGLVFEKVK